MIKKFFFPKFDFIKEDYLRKKIKFTDLAILIAVIATTAYAVIFFIGFGFGYLFFSTILTASIFSVARILLFYKKYNTSRTIIVLFSNLGLYISCTIIDTQAQLYLFFLPLCIMPIVLFDIREKKIMIGNGLVSPLLLTFLFYSNFQNYFKISNPLNIPLDLKYLSILNLFFSCFVLILLGLYLTYISSEKDSEIEEKRSILKNSRINLETLLDSIQDALVVIDNNYKVQESNSLFHVYFNELIGKTITPVENILDYFENIDEFEDIKKSIHESFLGFFKQKVYKIGHYHFEFSFSPVLMDLSVKSVIILVKNITEIKRYQEEILKSKDDVLAMVTSLDDMIFELNDTFQYVNIWTKNDELLVFPKEELIGKKVGETFPENLATIFTNHLNLLLYTKIPQTIEYQLNILNEKNPKWFQAKLNLFYTENEKSPKISILVRDITDKKIFIAELIKAKEIAEKSKKLESEFLSNMSHEIRTPLYGLIGLIELIIKEDLNPKIKENVELMKYSAGILLSIVNDILDLSKIENGIIDIKKDIFNLKEVVETSFRAIETLIGGNEVDLVLNFDEKIPTELLGDSLRLKQIFLNLLTNSAKFTAEGTINFNINKISESNQSVEIEFEVVDTGIGMEDTQLENLFLPYYQKRVSNHKIQGTGLGLTITKKLVELLNGKINVESVLGVGTSFKILIPFNLTEVKKEVSGILNPIDSFAVKLKDKKVLLVDDYETNLFVGKEILSLWNMIVETATDGLDALSKTKKSKFDLILMDIQMPNLAGDEVASLIHSDANNLNFDTPIIALSADVFDEVKERAKKAGMNGFVNKPFQLNELGEMISKNLKNLNS